jgi:DtxR family Mn-dependent transcriptional regulator
MSDLIDTTEMYLRTIYELVEEGTVPLRARIAEQLGQSGPTVSQTVARMERDGLLTVEGDRHLELTSVGRAMAMRVMRKHRLAECLLVEVIGLDWAEVHAEACRWEHVMSEAVERRLLELLDHPSHSPFGNPIPGLDELGATATRVGVEVPLEEAAKGIDGDQSRRFVVARIGESVQDDVVLMAALRRAGVRPGAVIKVGRASAGAGDTLLAGSGMEYVELTATASAHVFVERADGPPPS